MSLAFEVNTASSGSLTTSLVSYWKMADGADFYGSNTLTGVNTPTFVAGKIGNGVNYNGSSQYHTLASTITQSGSESIAGWFYIAGDGSVMGKDITVGYNFYFGTNGANYDIYTGAGTGVEQVSWSIAKASITNIWCHFVLTHDGTNAELHFNGTSKGTLAISTLAPIVNIGRAQSTSYMNGKVDELGVWSKKLSANEITDLYNGGSGQTMIGAIAFDAATASTSSINGASSMSVTHTATGSNRIAVIGFIHDNPSTVSSVTYDGVSCTFVRENTTLNGNYSNQLWYIIAPATGAKTVTVTFTGAAFGSMAVATFTGAKQSAQPNANVGVNAATATSVTLTMTTTVAPTWCVGFFMSGQSTTLGVSTNTTSRAQFNDTTYTYSIMMTSASSDQTPEGSFSQIGTWASNGCGGVGLAIQELNAAPSTSIKTFNGLAKASVKVINGLAIASVKSVNGLT